MGFLKKGATLDDIADGSFLRTAAKVRNDLRVDVPLFRCGNIQVGFYNEGVKRWVDTRSGDLADVYARAAGGEWGTPQAWRPVEIYLPPGDYLLGRATGDEAGYTQSLCTLSFVGGTTHRLTKTNGFTGFDSSRHVEVYLNKTSATWAGVYRVLQKENNSNLLIDDPANAIPDESQTGVTATWTGVDIQPVFRMNADYVNIRGAGRHLTTIAGKTHSGAVVLHTATSVISDCGLKNLLSASPKNPATGVHAATAYSQDFSYTPFRAYPTKSVILRCSAGYRAKGARGGSFGVCTGTISQCDVDLDCGSEVPSGVGYLNGGVIHACTWNVINAVENLQSGTILGCHFVQLDSDPDTFGGVLHFCGSCEGRWTRVIATTIRGNTVFSDWPWEHSIWIDNCCFEAVTDPVRGPGRIFQASYRAVVPTMTVVRGGYFSGDGDWVFDIQLSGDNRMTLLDTPMLVNTGSGGLIRSRTNVTGTIWGE